MNTRRDKGLIMRLRLFVYVLVIGILGLCGWKTYTYFFDVSNPILVLRGVESSLHYAGEMQCTVASTKTGDISIWLDEQPLVNQFRMSSGEHGYAFTIPTKTIANGKHTLRTALTDGTYHKNKAEQERVFYVDNVPLQAVLVKADNEYKVFQGRTLHVQFQVNKDIKDATITALSNNYNCFQESKNSSVYESFIPVACEENPNEYLLSIDITDKVGNVMRLENKFQVVILPFKKQTLQVTEDKVNDEAELGKDPKLFGEVIEKLTQNSPNEKLWKGVFVTPIEVQRISTEFGTIRTTQRKGRYAHKALDVLNLPKSVVWATQDGTVVMKDRYAMSGNTVIIDHGHGILSMFYHLDSFADIEEGQKISKGNPVGTLGKTGYASGYHLHWEMRVSNIPVDPMQWTKNIF